MKTYKTIHSEHDNLPSILDISSTAKSLIEQLENDAYDYAIDRMQRFIDAGDVAGSQIWMAIAHDIKYLEKRRNVNLRLV